jgi:hypothetical protein
MSTPLPFLLIMPSYNQAHYIASAVDSILEQADTHWELWIVDNSSDQTPEVMLAYTDPRIHFVHIPKRMDPGTCLNLILEQEGHRHRDFSYVHTDNLLRSDYVGRMRVALSHDERSIAYCDMRGLNETGALTGVHRRGSFDLARLFSLSTLGVPFSATVQLSRELGGFNRMDVADDVMFCVRSWPKARFEYVADAIMDYRLHGDSRTEAHGGANEIERSFLEAYLRLLPEMHAQGVLPIEALARRMQQLQIDMELCVQDIWYREGHLTGQSLPEVSLGAMMDRNMLELCDLNMPSVVSPELPETGLTRLKGKVRKRWYRVVARLQGRPKTHQQQDLHRIPRRLIWEQSTQFRHHAIPWLYLSASSSGGPEKPIRIASHDIYTLWTTFALHRICGWRFLVSQSSGLDFSKWPHLDVTEAGSSEELLVSVARGQIWVRPAL